jgi:hypothetical protein
MRAQVIGGIPGDLVGSLTGPHAGPLPGPRQGDLRRRAEEGRPPRKGANAAVVIEAAADRRNIEIYAKPARP